MIQIDYSAANALKPKALACMVCQNIIKSVLHLERDLVGVLMQENMQGKQDFCICENKGADQLCGDRTADQHP